MSALAVTLTVDELRALVREAVRAEVGERTPEAEVLTREQAAALLCVHPVIVARYVKRLALPAMRVGTQWRFRRSEILAWLDQHREAGTTPPPPRKLRSVKGGL